MKFLKQLILAGAASFALSGSALATDLMSMGTMTDEPMMSHESGFDWQGFYLGVLGGWDTNDYLFIGKVVGVNFMASDSILLGVELAVGYYDDFGGDTGTEGYLVGRAGLLAGDDVLLFAAAGISFDAFVYNDIAFGGGIEFAASDNLSLRLQFMRYDSSFSQIAGGAIWHIN